jgi:hypothetical protein
LFHYSLRNAVPTGRRPIGAKVPKFMPIPQLEK